MKKSMLWAALAVLTVTLGAGSAWAQSVCSPLCGLDYAKTKTDNAGGNGGGGGGPVIIR